MTAPEPRLGMGFHHSPRLSVVQQGPNHAKATLGREPSMREQPKSCLDHATTGIQRDLLSSIKAQHDSLPSSPTLQDVSISNLGLSHELFSLLCRVAQYHELLITSSSSGMGALSIPSTEF
ncbi:hypothetical protein PIB30_006577 [Stylosanthes scabra]|uniref:Uncharacterized protein n=1 Tax=Stylosanthes scabra TaxID=79078 RepID=A0ABU6Y3Q0_9FABA|nr:hypothetical protein [Stylosanthes scabra]